MSKETVNRNAHPESQSFVASLDIFTGQSKNRYAYLARHEECKLLYVLLGSAVPSSKPSYNVGAALALSRMRSRRSLPHQPQRIHDVVCDRHTAFRHAFMWVQILEAAPQPRNILICVSVILACGIFKNVTSSKQPRLQCLD